MSLLVSRLHLFEYYIKCTNCVGLSNSKDLDIFLKTSYMPEKFFVLTNVLKLTE
jgi:hypothetical protein